MVKSTATAVKPANIIIYVSLPNGTAGIHFLIRN